MSSFLTGLVTRAAGLSAQQAPTPPAPVVAGPADEPAELVEETEVLAQPAHPVRDRAEVPAAPAGDQQPSPAPLAEPVAPSPPGRPAVPPPPQPAGKETTKEEPPPRAPVPVAAPPLPVPDLRPEPAVAAATGAERLAVAERREPAELAAAGQTPAGPVPPGEVEHVFVPLPANPQPRLEQERPERITVEAEPLVEPLPVAARLIPAAPIWPSEQPPAGPSELPGEPEPTQHELVRQAVDDESVDRTQSVPLPEWPEPSSTTDTVEVHIGAIELTVAEPEAPAPQRAPPRPVEPEGFDAYAAIR